MAAEVAMLRMKRQASACALALGGAMVWGGFAVHADPANSNGIGTRPRKVFVVAMENHNWTQPNPAASPQQLFMTPAAPYLNSLVNGTSGISGEVAYAT